MLEQILLILIIRDLMRPLNVCLGWKLSKCSRYIESVGFLYSLVSNFWVFSNLGPLKVATSRKSTEFGSSVGLSLMEG